MRMNDSLFQWANSFYSYTTLPQKKDYTNLLQKKLHT